MCMTSSDYSWITVDVRVCVIDSSDGQPTILTSGLHVSGDDNSVCLQILALLNLLFYSLKVD